MKEEEKSIRKWYEAKTRRAIKWLVGFGVVSLLVGVVLFALLPDAVTLKLQVFNGAYTIPIGALIWLVIFTLIWMMPIREISFRTFESTEALREEIKAAIKDEIHPSVKRFEKIADQLEEKFEDRFLDRVDEALDSIAFRKEPLPVAKPASVAAPRKLPSVDNGEGEEK